MKRKLNDENESCGEIIADSVTHGIGFLLSIAALCVLVYFAMSMGDNWRVISFSVYGVSLMLLYLSSTLYHSLSVTRARKVFRVLDHSFIYVLIAGTYTPFALITLKGWIGWLLFIIVWLLAILGIVFKSIFIDKMKIFSTIVYIFMGWIIIVALEPLLNAISVYGFIWLLAGGLSYTLGIIFFGMKKLKYHHAIWHMFVLGGSTCHFIALLFYVLPQN